MHVYFSIQRKAKTGQSCIKIIYWAPWELVKAVSSRKDSVTTGKSLCENQSLYYVFLVIIIIIIIIIIIEHTTKSASLQR